MTIAPTVQLVCSAVKALGEVCRSGPLPLPSDSREAVAFTKATVVECLANKLKTGKDAKVSNGQACL